MNVKPTAQRPPINLRLSLSLGLMSYFFSDLSHATSAFLFRFNASQKRLRQNGYMDGAHINRRYFVLPSLTQKRWVLLRRNNSPSATTGEATNIWSASVLVAAISNFSPILTTVTTPLSLAR
jgi:hypothetical protein